MWTFFPCCYCDLAAAAAARGGAVALLQRDAPTAAAVPKERVLLHSAAEKRPDNGAEI